MAHLLTGVRLLAVVPAAWAFSRPDRVSAWLLVALVTVAIVTDYYDGVVARRSGTASAGGMLFDHTTDFLFVTSGLAGASLAGLVPALLPMLVVVAFTQYVLDSYFLHRQKQLRMSMLGRWNGILYFAPLVQIALSRLEWLPVLADLAAAVVRPFCMVLVVTTVASIADRAAAPLRARAGAG
jgi:CDP-diacylglycerol---glycerol-3-phosphate 3-phosphatidyltransferase